MMMMMMMLRSRRSMRKAEKAGLRDDHVSRPGRLSDHQYRSSFIHAGDWLDHHRLTLALAESHPGKQGKAQHNIS